MRVETEIKNDIWKDEKLQQKMKDILVAFDNNSDREGLQETPKRYLKFLNEFLTPESFNLTTFDSEGHNEMVIETNIPFYSLCEHHLAPFFGTASIAYIPNGKIVGLSKLPRILDHFSRRFQNQERITNNVANFISKKLEPDGVAVVLKAQHMCMSMRGVRKHNVDTITSAMRGAFLNDDKCRNEFLKLIS
jgi:GTP cyclohydrolase I